MSIIFGMRKRRGARVSDEELLRLGTATERYAFDGISVHASGPIGMGFQPYRTHLRSQLETGPTCDTHGNLLTFDGRLDNHRDLCLRLSLDLVSTADSEIVLAAFRRWGEDCFSQFIGDWSLALWSLKDHSLYLARDHAGTRSLYFRRDNDSFRWSTYLETFFVDQETPSLDEDYVACFLASQPIRDLTPYKGIRAVPPAHYLVVQDGSISTRPHWQWMNKREVRYSSDKDYEEHFLALFEQSVERRTGPGAPILAQLSGGMDSTSIVCLSDQIRRANDPQASILDTISFYDDSESSWNEKPYFSAVEKRRGKVGVHLEVSFMNRTFEPPDSSRGTYLIPGADSATIDHELRHCDATRSGGFRSILSGVGGDEVLGGVPTPLPELATYLATGQFGLLFRKSTEWCLADRSPLIHMLFETAKHTIGYYWQPRLDRRTIPAWMSRDLADRCATTLQTDKIRGSRFGLRPNSISNGLAWWSIMETLPHLFPGTLTRPEFRYPYLDRDLVDYLFSIPRQQLVRPGRRRSLMRRALKNIVPEEIIERRRKAFQLRGPLAAIQHAHNKIDMLFRDSLSSDCGFIEPSHFQVALDLTSKGSDFRWWPHIMRAIAFELWLRSDPARPRAPFRSM